MRGENTIKKSPNILYRKTFAKEKELLSDKDFIILQKDVYREISSFCEEKLNLIELENEVLKAINKLCAKEHTVYVEKELRARYAKEIAQFVEETAQKEEGKSWEKLQEDEQYYLLDTLFTSALQAEINEDNAIHFSQTSYSEAQVEQLKKDEDAVPDEMIAGYCGNCNSLLHKEEDDYDLHYGTEWCQECIEEETTPS